MEVKRICENCREVRDRGTYMWCRLLKLEVMEDDYCSFGGDIPEDDPWRDEPYERKKDERISSV